MRKVAGCMWHSVILEAIAMLVWWASPLLPPPPARAAIRAAKRAGIRWKTATRKHQATAGRLAPRCKPAGQYVHPSARPACWRLSALVVLVLLVGSFSAAAAAGTGWACQSTLYTAISGNVGFAAMASHMAQHQLSPHVAVWHMCHPQDNWYSDRWRQAGPAYAAVTSFQPEGVMYPVPHDRYEKDAEGGWVWGNHPGMPDHVKDQLKAEVRARKATAFAYSMQDLPGYKGIEPPFEIKLNTTDPIFTRARRYSPGELKVTDEKCTELDGAGIIEPAGREAGYASAPTLPGKKDADGNWTDVRFCIDFRNLNKHTVADKYGMHRPDELFRQVSTSRFFSKIDMRSGFLQIPVAEGSRSMTGFWWRNQLWCYRRMPFGLKNASAKFQRVMDCELAAAKLTGCAISFIDDLLIHSQTAEQHVKHVAAVLDMLQKVGLRAHPDKSIFAASVIEYLGHNVSHHGLTPHQAKVSAIRALRAPTNVSELRSVLGFLNYYRCYVPGFSELAAPMNNLLKKDAKWQWGPEQAAALEQLKAALCQDGVALRRFDVDAPTKLYTDWSKHGIAAVLTQAGPDGKEYLVACVSRSLNKHERNYSSYEGEMLAAVWGVLSLRSYLHGLQFTVVTDHQPLKWLVTTPELTGKHARWALCLMEYCYTIEHRPGKKHQNADVPSRFPSKSSHDGTGARLDPVHGEDPPPPPAADPPPPPSAAATDAEGAAGKHPPSPPPAAAATDADTTAVPNTAVLAVLQGGQLAVDHVAVELSAALHTVTADAALQQRPVASFMDGFAPTGSDQLAADLAAFADPDAALDAAQVADAPAMERTRQRLLQIARSWVDACSTKLRLQRPEPPLPLQAQFASNGTASEVASIDTTPVSGSFFAAASAEGITLYEPFGGMCAGLHMCLALGLRVNRYLYSDTSGAARQVAEHRLAQLHGLYPASFPLQAAADTFTALPQDVRQVDAAALKAAGAADGSQWLVVAGWECQDLSTAGKGKGLQGNRSNTFFPLVRIMAELQHLQQPAGPPPGFLIENVAAQHNRRHPNVSTDDHQAICAVLGTPVTVDAPRFGSLAHRLRNFWTNLASPEWLRLVVQHVHPPTRRVVNSILEPGRSTQDVDKPDAHPYYPANVPGKPMAALPTLVATQHSYAFSNGGQGMLRNSTGKLVQLTPEERERALGYPEGSTAAPGVTPKQRHTITGSCMDGYTMRGLMAICTILHHLSPHLGPLKGGAAPRPQVDLQRVPRDLLQGPGGQLLRSAGWVEGQPLPAASALAPIAAPLAATGQRGTMQRAGLGYAAGPGQLQAGPHLQQNHSAAAGAHSSHADTQRAASTSASQGLQQLALDDQVPSTVSSSGNSSALSTRAVVNMPITTPAFMGHGGDDSVNSTYEHNDAMLAHADQRELEQPEPLRDIWADPAALHFLRTAEHTSRNVAECKRVAKRARHYQFVSGRLHRTMADGTLREVPEPQQRGDLVKQVHERTGHWGIKRTKHLLQHQYYWNGMESDVKTVLANCGPCQQVAASFKPHQAELQPLPIRGLFYRWGCDLCGPFTPSSSGNTWCMLMIEHFTKHIELVAIPAKEAQHTARAFLAGVVSRFGASAEVLTDNGAEFAAEFDQLLEECFIDHRHTSPAHPQADGLAERAIQSVKRALKTHVAATASTDDWDVYMHWLGLGYRCSRQSATGLSPYEMLYGTAPVIPPAIRERFAEPLDLDDPDAAAEHMQRRAALMQQHCAVAMGNLASAQHRDTERYKRLRSADYQPRTVQFTAGQFVWRRRYFADRQPTPGLQTEARPGIYRILEVRDSGVLVLQGQCGSTLHEHASNCAPCHLPNINTTIDPSLRQVTADFPCCVCNSPEDEDIMLLCDGCGRGFHIYCLEPPLVGIPEGTWVCPTCVGKGVTAEQAAQLQAERVKAQQAARPAEALIPTAKQREVDELARQLDGRVVRKSLKRGDGTVQHLYGRLCFRGRLTKWPKHFRVEFANGTSQLITFKTAKAWLQPEGAQPPADEPVLLSVVLLSTTELADTWQLHQPDAVCHALEGLTGLHVRQAEGEQLAAAVRGHVVEALPGHVGTVLRQMPQAVLQVLLGAINLHTVGHVLDPWHCTMQLGPLLQQHGPASIRLSTNTVVHPPARRAEGHSEHLALDPLQPASYRTWLRAAPAEVGIFKPPADLADMALAIALAFCSSAVCMLVPNTYLTDSSYFRSGWFARLQQEGVLVTLPCPKTKPAAVWVLVFKSAAARRRLMSAK